MKAISLKQPWATWIQVGDKTIETRTWPTKHRGPLLICASKRPKVCETLRDGRREYPAGCAVCVVTVLDCRPMTPEDEDAALCDCEPGRWAWLLDRIVPITAFPVRGQLGLFEVELPTAVKKALEGQGYA